MIRCIRIWSGEDGNSYFEEGAIDLVRRRTWRPSERQDSAPSASPFRRRDPGGAFAWHDAPARQFVITLSGTLDFQTRKGEHFIIRPGDILLAEDTAGTGHSWRLIDENLGGASMSSWRRASACRLSRNPHKPNWSIRRAHMPQSAIPGTPDVVLIGAGIMSATLGTVPQGARAVAHHRHVRDARGLRAGKLGRLEQRRHRPRRQLRAELHARSAQTAASTSPRRWRSMSSSTCRASSGRTWSRRARSPTRAPSSIPCPHMSFVLGQGQCRVPAEARYKAMSAHHCYHGMEYSEDRSQIADWAPLVMEGRDDERAVRGDAHHHRHRRRLRRADPSARARTSPRSPASRCTTSTASPASTATSDGRWRVEVEDVDSGEVARGHREIRLHRRRRRRAAAAAEVAASPKGTAMAASRSAASGCAATSRGQQAPSCQGLRQGRRRLAADVGAASRHAHHRRTALAAVRPLCRLLHKFPQARLAHGPVPSRSSLATSCRCWPWRATISTDRISDRAGAADLGAPVRHASSSSSRGEASRLEAGGRRPARADHQAGRKHGPARSSSAPSSSRAEDRSLVALLGASPGASTAASSRSACCRNAFPTS